MDCYREPFALRYCGTLLMPIVALCCSLVPSSLGNTASSQKLIYNTDWHTLQCAPQYLLVYNFGNFRTARSEIQVFRTNSHWLTSYQPVLQPSYLSSELGKLELLSGAY